MTPFVAWSKSIVPGSRLLNRSRRRARTVPTKGFWPQLDPMEDRTLLSTLTVTNNHDSGSGSLRAAIGAAASGDTIRSPTISKVRPSR